MSLTLSFEVVRDTATPELNHIVANVNPHRLAGEIGPRATRLVQRNFLKKGENKKGWPTTHFWARAAEATNWTEGPGFVIISANQIGLRQRIEGGDINPTGGRKYLTIPAVPDAYGKRAKEYSNLEFGFALDPDSGKMRPCLKEKKGSVSGADVNKKWVRDKTTGKYKEVVTTAKKGAALATGITAIFWLLGHVHQEPDPEALPSDAEFSEAMDKSIQVLLHRPNITGT